ncbi:HAD-superfamily subfamily IB hydrolase, TIGR01490 [Marinitoga piezophila KA3]|uniref:HAD-superfamily subfamily IB hydrolase, TIGR01490 n=1 Tax=Marinitoga piezophila (strain DSM 14283 / JCM 11233 / KA3) TaxID=443254 RepID=H2J7X7_MARPK|nr:MULTISPECIES: HAD family hydrolase [Marinitoga]AEX85468.1 HAD-superfamily subfamily IB hydrolase, TIGR01490 [Marinitoga piezophila KA3]
MKKYVAFFDLDKTILDTYSPKLYYKYEIKHGKFPLWKYYKMGIYTIFYKMGIEIKDMETMVKEMAMKYKGQNAEEAFSFARQWFEEDGKYHIRESIKEEIEFHRSNGAYLSLISASPDSLVAPFAEYLKFDDMICTKTIVENGIITGEIGTYMYEKNKVIEAKKLCEKNGFDIKDAYFYSDSISDLPLLETVGNPICVNPDLRLKWIAKKRGWRIIYK